MRLLLVRHALVDPVGVSLPGRRPGVSLNAAGRAQLGPLVERVRRRLGGAPLHAVVASPLARTQETAGALARAYGLAVETEPGLVEFGLGAWTGRTLASLEGDAARGDPGWQHFNSYRGGTRAGGDGELQLEVQARAVAALLARARAAPEATLAAVSHGDVIKAALGHFLGVPVDLQQRLEVSPTGVSEVELAPWGPRVIVLNDVS